MSIDERLLQANQVEKQLEEDEESEASIDRAGELRRRVRGMGANQEQDWQSHSGKRRKAGVKEGTAESIKDTIPQPSLSTFSSGFLRSAWQNIIMSFGFSFFYVYAHLFLRRIFGERYFAPLGSEWLDKPGMTVQQREEKGRPFKMIETIGVGAITLLLIFIILSALSVVALIVDAVSNPLRMALEALKDFFTLE